MTRSMLLESDRGFAEEEAEFRGYLFGLIPWLMVIIGLCLAGTMWVDEGSVAWLMFLGPAGLLVALLQCAIRSVLLDRRFFYRPIVVFCFACALYYGIGPLLYTFGSAGEIAYTKVIWDFSDKDVLRTTILNSSCILGIVVVYLLGSDLLMGGQTNPRPRSPEQHSAVRDLPLWMGLAGLAIKFWFGLPYALKLVEAAPPGMLLGIGVLSYGAEIALWKEVADRNRNWVFPTIFTLLDVAYGVVALSKLFIILPVLSMLLGLSLSRVFKGRWLLAIILGAGILFTPLVPLISFLRLERASGEAISLPHILDVLTQSMDEDGRTRFKELRQDTYLVGSSWTRLSYVNLQAFCLHRIQEDDPIGTYRDFKVLFIPRFLWPDKPLMNPGGAVNVVLVGSDESATGVTLFGEAYLNGGHWGAVLFCAVFGMVLRLMEAGIRLVIFGGRMEYAVLLYSGVFVGVRVDDYAVMITGAVLSAAALGGIVYWLSEILLRFRSPNQEST